MNYQNLYSSNTLFYFRNSWFHNDWWDNTESNNKSKSEYIRSELSVNYFPNDIHRIVAGIEGSYSIVSSNIFSNPTAFGLALYGQDEIRVFRKLKLTTGLRIDYQNVENNLTELNFNPKVGLNYSYSDNLFFRASAGRGYRAPTPSELFSTTNVSGIRVVPNPDLKSESSWSFEAGMNYTIEDLLKFDVAVFDNELYNFIEPYLNPAGSFIQFRNVTRARILGSEVNFSTEFFNKKLKMDIGYTYLHAWDLNNNHFLKYRPKHLVYISSSYKYNFIQLGVDFRYWNRLDKIDDELIQYGIVKDGDLRDKVFLTDLNLSFDLFQFKIPLRLYFTVNNLLNYNYIEMIGNLGPIRSFTISVDGIL